MNTEGNRFNEHGHNDRRIDKNGDFELAELHFADHRHYNQGGKPR
ncbi:hypothetical protein SDC9_203471 [bioreactor metagenome]|uniref:Uncharacterized protein n=1 Tax=bioreactor metagenome TaxID=1076179 RepID=A0A645IXC3_9ZZZZ